LNILPADTALFECPIRGIIAAWPGSMCSKTWFFLIAGLNLLFIGLTAKLLEKFKNQVPIGYEDETGFHYGIPRE
jgi:hypothetical protein